MPCLRLISGLRHNHRDRQGLISILKKTITGLWIAGKIQPILIDSLVTKSGKYSASIENIGEESSYGTWSYTIPENYMGKKITLSAFIRTENVSEGFAGIWLRIDPEIGFDSMANRPVTGTTDWTRYETTLTMDPTQTTQFVFGGLLVGKGKVWFDDFKVSIDGKEIENLKPLEAPKSAAANDKEFVSGSKITLSNISVKQLEDLKVLGLVWGYLKYYHPNVATGAHNWGFELFRVLPKVLDATSPEERDMVLLTWVNNLGSFSCCTSDKTDAKDIKLKPDLDWINSSGFSPKLSALLLEIKTAKRPAEHYYVGLHPNVGNPNFRNEDAYASMRFPDDGYRLLSLYRYWNMIQYFFQYKNLIEEDWKDVLSEFIPRIISVKNETEYVLTLQELIGRIHDTHANVWGGNEVLAKYIGERFAPVEIGFVEDKAEVVRFHELLLGSKSGLEIGDMVTAVNGRELSDLVKERLKNSPASNYPTQLRDIGFSLLRSNDSLIQVNYIRNGQAGIKSVRTYSQDQLNVYSKFQVTDTCFRMLDNGIAYINHGSLQSKYLPQLWEKIKDSKALIIDIRNNPSDFLVFDLGAYLMPEPTPFVKFTNGSVQTPGLFTYEMPTKVGRNNKNYYNGKLIILVNETSQSSAEYHSMAYRAHPNAVVVGSTTAGADGNVSKIQLPGGVISMISGIGVYYPDGKETQRVGIVPDVEVKPTIEGVKNGRDEVLERAIQLIEN